MVITQPIVNRATYHFEQFKIGTGKRFGYQMCSEFECSELEPPLFITVPTQNWRRKNLSICTQKSQF